MDIIKADDKYCLNGCSVGMDAIVAKNMINYKRLPFVSGSLAYNLAIVKAFFGKIGMTFKLKLDDIDMGIQNCLFAVIANAPYYGGGYMGAPNAIPYDRKLDFTQIDTISRLKILRFLPLYKKGEQAGLDFCTMKRCTNMEIEAQQELPVNLDGEIFFSKKIKFEIIENGIKFHLPKSIAKNILINV